ncbi:hypothetical protein E8E14_000937 [Neopestalotiopsis sp. 37M]|nr:hypothetical protein E8E14_000937 [Neopestalotiopsis sp. 37M]
MNPELIAERRLREQKLKQRHILADRRRIESLTAPRNGQIRKVNFDNFKNHYGQNHAPIEVLVAGSGLMSEVREQMDLHMSYSHNIRHGLGKTLFSDEADVSFGNDTSLTQAGDEDEQEEIEGEIQRVRIHSLHVLAVLTLELNIHTSWYWPRTFFRPFKALVYLQSRLKDRLAKWEAKWPRDENGQIVTPSIERRESELNTNNVPFEKTTESNTKEKSPASSFKSFPLSDNTRLRRQDYLGTVEAIDALRVYLEFVDNEIMPLYNRFDGVKAQVIAFDDLWSLFRPGELVYVPSTGKSDDCYHEVWRLYRVSTSAPVPVERENTRRKDGGWQPPPKEHDEERGTRPPIPLGDDRRRPPPPPMDGPHTLSEQWFTLYCYYIDHDSHAYGAVRQKFTIGYFSGERAIDSLAIFPLRFLSDCASKRASLKAQGQKFQRLLEGAHRYQSYSSWTLIRNPPCDQDNHWESKIPNGPDGEPLRHPEFIESNVIVDLAEAFQTVPSWKPEFHKPTPNKTAPSAQYEDRLGIRRWDTRSKDVMFFETPEFIQTQDGIEIRQRNLNLDEDSFLRSRIGDHRSLGVDLRRDYELNDEDLMLLPKRVFAYSLRDRKFAIVDLNFLEDTKHDTGVFHNLQIPAEHKTVVSGLVSSHFEGKELERRLLTHRRESISQDLVQGKGKGLVMLLHGAPGVGKTATAEAVAMEYRKPLFVMTCGDLGLTPDEIEKSLTKIFRLAHLWECVLLLDEADVFLQQRSVLDMTRNAMVSENQTVNIFEINLAKLKEIEEQRSQAMRKPMLDIQHADILNFAQLHFRDSDDSGRWNGRQIRNAFQIASSLAHHNFAIQCAEARRMGREEPARPVLHQHFFRQVQTATQEFSEYMAQTIGVTDAKRALERSERQDDFIANVTRQQSVATQFTAAGSIGSPEYKADGFRYGQPSASPQPAVTWNASQYPGVAQNLGQGQYQTQLNHPTSFFSPQAQFNTMQPSQSYITTQMSGGQPTGSQPTQAYAQPLAQTQLYAQQPMQQTQVQPFGQSQTSSGQQIPVHMATQGQPQASLYHQPGQVQLQNQAERQQIQSEMPQMAINAQPSLPNMV